MHATGIKVEKRIGVEVPAMGGIAEGTEIGVVRSGDENCPARLGDAVKFFHGGDDVRDVFDDVFRADLIERIIAEGQAAVVEMAEDIGGGGWIHVEADGAGIFCRPTAYVENARQTSSSRKVFGQFSGSHECEKGCGKQNSTGPRLRACAICETVERRCDDTLAYIERSISVMQASTVRT